jgi:hypothetical protein
MSYLAAASADYEGTVVGNGQCVAYVREASGAPATNSWRRGVRVRDAAVPSGTAIAAFDDDGSYGNHTDGRSHAAILVGVGPDGLIVHDQWVGQPVHERVIYYRGGQGRQSNDGDAFFVIE